MLSLFVLILFGIGIAIFATQNAQLTSLTVGPYGFAGIPMYAVVLAALLVGIFVSWLISLVGLVSNSMTLRGKDGRIRDAEHKIHNLEQKNHDLEIENSKLRGEKHYVESEVNDDDRPHTNPFVRFRQRFS